MEGLNSVLLFLFLEGFGEIPIETPRVPVDNFVNPLANSLLSTWFILPENFCIGAGSVLVLVELPFEGSFGIGLAGLAVLFILLDLFFQVDFFDGCHELI